MKPGLGKATPAWTSTRIKVIDISEVNRIVNLLKKVDCTNYALISDVSKEMGIKKTALMQFVEDNPKLFKLVEVKKKDKVVGLGIRSVYTDQNQNPVTEEWLKVQKVMWGEKINVSEMSYYGQHEFYYLKVDDPKDSLKEGLWRNTPEKIQTLIDAEAICEKSTCYGGLGDCSNWTGLLLTKEAETAIKGLGWELVYPGNNQR
jgi:hypothetical protein